MKIGDKMYVPVTLLSLPDRMDEVTIKLPLGRKESKATCCSFYLTNNKVNTETMLRMLKYEFEKEISECESISDCEVLTRVYKKAEEIIRGNQ